MANANPSPTVSRRKLLSGTGAAVGGMRLPLGQRPAVASTNGKIATEALATQGITAGYGLAVSVRLPLFGIGSGQIQPLLTGQVENWREVGCPLSLPVSVIGLEGAAVDGVSPGEVVADYTALATKLATTPGGVAVVPLDQIDMQVSVLDIDGDAPLLQAGTSDTPITKLGFGGDILFGRNVGIHMRKYGDFTFPMLQLKDLFASFDLTICNWECFVSETIDPPELADKNTYDFVTEPPAIDGVLMSGIDAVSMANNHAFFSVANYGPDAYFDTVSFMDAKGLPHFGAGKDLSEARKPFTTEINGISIAILGIDGVTANVDFPSELWGYDANAAAEDRAGTNPLVLDNIVRDIQSLASQYDVVIPFFHMGQELVWYPRDFEMQVTNACIEAGAAAVISSHPHTIMGMHTYRDKPVFDGLGNLVYDQMFSVDSRTGYILDLTLKGKNVIGFRIHGFENFDFCQGRLMPPGENAALLNRFWRSTDLTTKYRMS